LGRVIKKFSRVGCPNSDSDVGTAQEELLTKKNLNDMEKKKEVLNEIREYCKSVSTGLGEMFVGYDTWNEIADDADVVGGEIYLLRKRNGEHEYQVLGRQYEPYDRVNDFADECVDVFQYNENTDELLEDVFDRCFKHRYEDAIYMNDYNAVKDLTDDFKYCEDMIDDFLTSDAYVLTISEYLNCDVVERYPMVWFEDVYEYRIALKLPDELV
jgi:hypothetical protein